mmetsp:Transcript_6734/g.28804  ORF Transcript_6734/g.28804 Transcript_6734/m.28804 type:complete len:261 (-) Transcript_6734:568-1350(-)
MMEDPVKDHEDQQSIESDEGSEKPEDGIDSPGFTGELLSVEEKIRLASIEKEKGNALFKAGEIEKAWKQYDVAFVNVFIGKEEWASLTEEQRNVINTFKCPCHLNRGLCRLKLGHYEDALWDFSEAVRIDPENVKGRYRRAVCHLEMVKLEMKKEGEGRFWDIEKQQHLVVEVHDDLVFAIRKNPNDPVMRETLRDMHEVEKSLRNSRIKYKKEQEKTFSGFLRSDTNESSDTVAELVNYDDMPALEKIVISDGKAHLVK